MKGVALNFESTIFASVLFHQYILLSGASCFFPVVLRYFFISKLINYYLYYTIKTNFSIIFNCLYANIFLYKKLP